MTTELTSKQQLFVQEYLLDLNATQAAIRAGYSEKTANPQAGRLLANVSVQEEIQKAFAERQIRLQIAQDFVLMNLKDISDRCMQAVPVKDRNGQIVFVENKDGVLCPAYTFNAHGAIRANELIGKHLGMFSERIDHSHSGTVSHEHKGKVELVQEIMKDIDGKTSRLVQDE